jgi:predicted transcriptional regulator
VAKRRATGDLEAEVLAHLWAARRPCTTAEVLRAMGDDLAYTTIETILNRLHSKELADRERVGRAFAYSPRFTEAELAAQRMRATLDRATDREAALSRFVDTLSRRDERALRRILDELDELR